MTWTFSGLLSMGPFPIMDRLTALTVGDTADRDNGEELDVTSALRGSGELQLSSWVDKHPHEAIASIQDFGVKEIEYTSFAGEPIYLASNGLGQTRIVPMHGSARSAFDSQEVMRVLRDAAGGNLAELHVMEEYDAYYLDRHGELPLPVIYARLNDAVGTRYYIDLKTARVVGEYSARGWVNRWLYHGLHSLNFPWLYKYRPLWDIVVISLMLGGTALCATSLVLTWRVIARKLVSVARVRLNPPNEDLDYLTKSSQ
jgi:hypothetical protein